MTFAEIRADIRSNLNDAGVTFYSADDITESMQDAYDDIAFKTHCIIKKTTISFVLSPYMNLASIVDDFMAVTAIFNNNTNRWLLDCLTLRDFDKLRDDWELWTGTPQFWATVNFELAALTPYYSSAPSLGMDLYYAAQAPTLADADSPLIATDFQNLIENYCTADLLEQAEEYSKAIIFWTTYIKDIPDYRDRVKRLAKRDLLLIA